MISHALCVTPTSHLNHNLKLSPPHSPTPSPPSPSPCPRAPHHHHNAPHHPPPRSLPRPNSRLHSNRSRPPDPPTPQPLNPPRHHNLHPLHRLLPSSHHHPHRLHFPLPQCPRGKLYFRNVMSDASFSLPPRRRGSIRGCLRLSNLPRQSLGQPRS